MKLKIKIEWRGEEGNWFGTSFLVRECDRKGQKMLTSFKEGPQVYIYKDYKGKFCIRNPRRICELKLSLNMPFS